MNSNSTMPTASPPNTRPFTMPMMAFFSITNHSHGTVAHALDFDLVSVGSTEEEAVAKLRLAVKHHIEFGLMHRLCEDILWPAPTRYWDALSTNAQLSLGEPIVINHYTIKTTLATTDELEPELAASAA